MNFINFFKEHPAYIPLALVVTNEVFKGSENQNNDNHSQEDKFVNTQSSENKIKSTKGGRK